MGNTEMPGMKEFEDSLAKLRREQMERESGLLHQLMSQASTTKDLKTFEADLAARKNEILFKVTAEIEDCQAAVKEAEELLSRLKKHLIQLQGLHRILTK